MAICQAPIIFQWDGDSAAFIMYQGRANRFIVYEGYKDSLYQIYNDIFTKTFAVGQEFITTQVASSETKEFFLHILIMQYHVIYGRFREYSRISGLIRIHDHEVYQSKILVGSATASICQFNATPSKLQLKEWVTRDAIATSCFLLLVMHEEKTTLLDLFWLAKT